MRILFFTNPTSIFSCICLKKLLDAGENVIGIVSPQELIGGRPYYLSPFQILHKYGIKFCLAKITEKTYAKLRIISRSLMKLLNIRIKSDRYYSVKELAQNYSITIYTPRNINDSSFLAKLHNFNPDLIIVATFRQVIPKSIINFPRYKCINIHPSFLPKYRGPDPIFWVLQNKEIKTGASIHYIDKKIDSGNIITQREVRVSFKETERSLNIKLAKIGADLLLETVNRIKSGNVVSYSQDEKESTYFGRRFLRNKKEAF